MDKRRKIKEKAIKTAKGIIVFFTLLIGMILTMYLQSQLALLFAGAFLLYTAILLLNKGNKWTVNLRSDITAIAFAVVILIAATYLTLLGNTLALIIAALMIVLIILLYKVI